VHFPRSPDVAGGHCSIASWMRRGWPNAISRVAPEGVGPAQAVDGAIARIKQILSE
jgi:hypothetical protein